MSKPCVMVLMRVTILVGAICASSQGRIVELSSLDLTKMTAGWGRPVADKSVQDQPMRIAGRLFEKGVGTHVKSVRYVDLKGQATRFTAYVGVDDEVNGNIGSVEFRVYGDGKFLWTSGPVK